MPNAELLYLLQGDPAELVETLAGMAPADIAEALRELPPAAAATVVAVMPFDLAVRVLDEPELEVGYGIIQSMEPGAAAALIEAMSADQQADLVRGIPPSARGPLLDKLDPDTRHTLKLLLEYRPDTAGGIMTTEVMTVPADWSVAQTLEYIKKVAQQKETVYVVYLLDHEDRLVGVVSLRQLIVADGSTTVLDAGSRRAPVTVTPSTDREEVARVIAKYNLLAVPVVDEREHVVGIVTVDDVIDAIVREQTEDAQKFGGTRPLDAPYMDIGLGHMLRKRAPWLCALFLSEMLTATAMQRFQGEIERAALLAMFIPLVMSSGGNSGSQATSLIIRAMALGEIRLRDWWRIAVRELPTGLMLGTILGLIGFARVSLWQALGIFNYGPHHVLVALTVALALVGIVSFGSLAGSMLPFILRRLGFDPASASAPFVATLVDVTGLVIYFNVALLVLRGTLL
ncbi:MAG TPA: magnesium transporter [Gemmatimonadaceae bacterium]|jgi:magnesium transporter